MQFFNIDEGSANMTDITAKCRDGFENENLLLVKVINTNVEVINANNQNFQVLWNLILRKRAKFALINSALIYSALIYSCVNLFP